MSQVYNWQIGREMEYPYSAKFPERQFAAIFNTNRCIACQTCTMACKSTWTYSKGQEYMWWNNVETKPYGGYPHFWDIKILKLLSEAHANQNKEMYWSSNGKSDVKSPYGEYKGMTVFEAGEHERNENGQSRALGYLPEDHEWSKPNIHEDAATSFDSYKKDKLGFWQEPIKLPEHKSFFFYIQRICNHCSYPACLAACPRKAIYKRPEDGVVLIDQERCRGYRKCMEACPYKKPMYNGQTKVTEKCIACYPRLEGKDKELSPEGVPIETRCMSSCVGKIRLQGLVEMTPEGTWKKDESNPLYFLIHKEKIALPMYPQFGTEPNMYYIPPRWVPRAYLKQMFGPGVEDAIAKYTCPTRETLAILQLFRAQREIIYKYEIKFGDKIYDKLVTMPDGSQKTLEIFKDIVIGYNKLGKECVRVGVQEEMIERSGKHYNSI